MAAAPRAHPPDYFSDDEWASLTARSSWRGLWLVAHGWGVIALAMLVGVVWPLTLPSVCRGSGKTSSRVGSRCAIQDLREIIADPDRRVEIEAVEALELIGKRDEIPDLLRVFAREDRFTRVRIAGAVRAIMRRERRQVVEYVVPQTAAAE